MLNLVMAGLLWLTPDPDSHHASLRMHDPEDARQRRVANPTQPASLIPDRTNAPSAVPLQEPTAAAPPNEALRMALPVIVVLLLCVIGWYARSQQRKASRTLPPAQPDKETPSQPSP